MTGSMFAAFTSPDGSPAVNTATALAVICKLATERLWPATSADGAHHGGKRHLGGLIILPACQGPPPASPAPQQQSQYPFTTSPPQETEDSTLGKRPRDEPTDSNAGVTSGAGATLLTTITPTHQVRLSFYVSASRGEHTKSESGLQSATHSQSGGSAWFGAQDETAKESKTLRRKYAPV